MISCHVPLSRLSSKLCPVLAYSRMVAKLAGLPSDPAFALPGNSGLSPLSYHWIDSKFKSVFSRCGLDLSCYSFHSMRRGGSEILHEVLNSPLCLQVFLGLSFRLLILFLLRMLNRSILKNI